MASATVSFMNMGPTSQIDTDFHTGLFLTVLHDKREDLFRGAQNTTLMHDLYDTGKTHYHPHFNFFTYWSKSGIPT